MKKILLYLKQAITCCPVILLMLSYTTAIQAESVESTANTPGITDFPPIETNKQSGLTLDIARHFYPVDVINAFIDTISKSGGTFLHLHFSDHENYALESDILNQRSENAIRGEDGVYINPVTGKPFLTYQQLNQIVRYAKAKNIELIPELDSPNHMTAIFTLLEKERGEDYVQSLKSKWTDDEIDITNPESISFIKKLMNEIIEIFGDSSRHFHIGGDEFGYSIENNHEFIAYANTLSEFLAEKGLKTRMWNDGLIKNTLAQLNPAIEITYWSYDGDTENPQEAEKRRAIRVSMPELIEKNFRVLNYNSYYLYLNPKQHSVTSHDADFAARDALKNWRLGIWDKENRHNLIKDSNKILGASLTIWGENAGDLDSAVIQKYTEGLLEIIIRKTNAESETDGNVINVLEKLSDNDFAALNQKSYIDLSQVKNDMLIYLDKPNQTVSLLRVETLKNQKITFRIEGLSTHRILLNTDWIKTDVIRHKQKRAYQVYQYLDNQLWLDTKISVNTISDR